MASVTIRVGDCDLTATGAGVSSEGKYMFDLHLAGGENGEIDHSWQQGSGLSDCSAEDQLRTALSFLAAVAESVSFEMRNPGRQGSNIDLFPRDVAEWAYYWLNDIESLMACEE